jgi:hypothetical protein
MNWKVVQRSFSKHFGPLPKDAVEYVARFAEGFGCADTPK